MAPVQDLVGPLAIDSSYCIFASLYGGVEKEDSTLAQIDPASGILEQRILG